ncbi:hypothetical protein GCM10023238_05460 [Streptomyces heliomycini]
MVLRVLAAVAAVTAIGGAVVMRHWDIQAGKRVAELTRARAGDEWRFEERVAELESDLEESRELRTKLEQRLRAKRAELAGLRNEHAALLRRYAASEVDRASVLEERRVLEIEAAVPAARCRRDSPRRPTTRRRPRRRCPRRRRDGGAGRDRRRGGAGGSRRLLAGGVEAVPARRRGAGAARGGRRGRRGRGGRRGHGRTGRRGDRPGR